MSDLLLPLLLFAFVSLLTPGPNNVMLTASGATFGFRRSVPHMLGIALGFPAMVLAVGIGFGALLAAYPGVQLVLKWVGVLYLCWLAWLIASASPGHGDGAGRGRPLRFIEAAAFQWVNPKAWIIAGGAIATFGTGSGHMLGGVPMVALVFIIAGLPSVTVWTAFGGLIGRSLSSRRRQRAFNIAMGLLLLTSIIPAVA